MKLKVKLLRKRISEAGKTSEKARRDRQEARRELKQYINMCHHKYKVKYYPIHIESYTSEFLSSPRSEIWNSYLAIGSDYPLRTIDRWKYECRDCGFIRYSRKSPKSTNRGEKR